MISLRRQASWFVLSAIAASAACEPAIAGYGLADGGFDSQGASVSTYCYSSACPSGSWSSVGNAGLMHTGNPDWGGPTAPSPASLAFIQLQGTITQTFTATASGSVRLVWFDMQRQNTGQAQTYTVTVSGTNVGTFSANTVSFVRHYSQPFAVNSGSSYTIQFAGQTTSDNTAFIDSVDIQPANETINYNYDALGRLNTVSHAGAINGGMTSNYQMDPADNRTNVTVTGAPH